jgi:hypothetical protein
MKSKMQPNQECDLWVISLLRKEVPLSKNFKKDRRRFLEKNLDFEIRRAQMNFEPEENRLMRYKHQHEKIYNDESHDEDE